MVRYVVSMVKEWIKKQSCIEVVPYLKLKNNAVKKIKKIKQIDKLLNIPKVCWKKAVGNWDLKSIG